MDVERRSDAGHRTACRARVQAIAVCNGNICRAWGLPTDPYRTVAEQVGADMELTRCRGGCMRGPVVRVTSAHVQEVHYGVSGARVTKLLEEIRGSGAVAENE